MGKLSKAFELHKQWLQEESSGERFCWIKYRDCEIDTDEFVGAHLREADFSSSQDLEGFNFAGADLRQAHFIGSNLAGANFEKADLFYADLTCASLKETNFYRANLAHAELDSAVLIRANCKRANFSSVSFDWAYISDIDFFETNFFCARFWNTDITRTKFERCSFKDTNFAKANISDSVEFYSNRIDEGTSFFAFACPEKGSYIGYKVANNKIVELEITADALRSSATTRKCRASKAKVLSITELDGSPANVDSVCSDKNPNFIYKVGEIVEVKDFDTNRWKECSTGIHHFITREEAVYYDK